MTAQRNTPTAKPFSRLIEWQGPAPALHQAWATDDGPNAIADTLSDPMTHTIHETLADELNISNSWACTFGMPAERQARVAARRAFVALKLSFLHVVDGLVDRPELQSLVHQAEEPHELWTLRATVFAALSGHNPQHRSHRQLLNRSLDTMFPVATAQLN